jgi:surface antigen
MVRLVFLPIYLFISVMILSSSVEAQYGGLSGGRLENPFFTPEDRQIIREIADNMLNDDPDGSSRPWSNTKSGSSGNLSIVRSYEYKGMPCRDLEVDNKTGERKGQWALRMCRIKDGTWKIAE